jgi:hypothetical protein
VDSRYVTTGTAQSLSGQKTLLGGVVVSGGDLRLDGANALTTDTDDVDVSTHLAVGGNVSSAGRITASSGLDASSGTFTATGAGQYSVATSSGINMLAGTFNAAGNIRVTGANALTTDTDDVDVSTHLAVAGNISSTDRITAASGLDASSGTFTATGAAQYSVATSSGINMQSGTLNAAGNIRLTGANALTTDTDDVDVSTHFSSTGRITATSGLDASSGTFTATGAGQYSVATSSGINMQAGTFNAAGNIRLTGANALTTDTDDVDVSTHLAVVGNVTAANLNYDFLASNTLGSAAASITVTIPSGYPRLYVSYFQPGSSATNIIRIQFNGDTANNYADRRSDDAGAPTAGANIGFINTAEANTGTGAQSCTFSVANVSTSRKLVSGVGVSDAGAPGTAPRMLYFTGVWNNTSSEISSITLLTSAGNMNSGTTIRVWGAQ